ncbi:ribosomal-protein-alanine N-acetyltransferase [Paucibacter oligotrophus]|uniref:[Ribosomal protein bS18]-alanine N-acetyltransferase n=1 Tax=Roseateles oligotrophus TaxID=1769250 RepID=A0A840LG21_9BURK|nr:ribosomal protein S18-alanine N-acetyltransferase [Roseateles oligotrophus]MBB4845573.1 ribosomal-protein-alanine N-acetyltransferase [Roseateles oligotrophus]
MSATAAQLAMPAAPSSAGQACLRPLRLIDLPAIMAIERRVYAQPWTEGNFIDSLASDYPGFGLWLAGDPGKEPLLAAYFLAMKGVGEMHLLNISVRPENQGQGLARRMLDALVRLCRSEGCEQLWLEVRTSNTRAREVYRRYGLQEVGLRRAYYPAHQGQREDAVLMSLPIDLMDLGQNPGSEEARP